MAPDTATVETRAGTVNPITAEIIRYGLMSIPNQIDVNITRTAYSPLVYEYKDYAVGIVDPEGRLISQSSGGIPLFVANALGTAVNDGIAIHGRDGIEPGDVIFSNHAGTLGQHLNNVVMYTPVFAGSECVAFMCVLVHWIDVGGMVVGSCAPVGPTEIFQEGIQFRSVKLWSRGEARKDIYRIIEYNTRFPRMLLGDIESQLAGCLMGRDLIAAQIEKYGLEAVRASVELMWRRSEAAARASIAAIPDGIYRASSFLDNDGVELDKKMPVDVVVTVSGDEMTVDFSGVADQVKGPINSGREGGAVTAARIAFKYIAAPDDPANDGSFRPLKIDDSRRQVPERGADRADGAVQRAAADRDRHGGQGAGRGGARPRRRRPSRQFLHSLAGGPRSQDRRAVLQSERGGRRVGRLQGP